MKRLISGTVILVLSVVLSPGAAAQKGARGPEIAHLQLVGNTMVWRAHIGFESLTMRITGPDDFLLEREYRQQDPIELSSTSFSGPPLSDGLYSYELRVVPRNRASRPPNADVNHDRPASTPFLLPEQSGFFTIFNGSFLDPNLVESESGGGLSSSSTTGSWTSPTSYGSGTVTAMDVVHPDDVIIQGSLCVGFDCVNGESFSFDTIRMKENNTRVKFEDTSGAGFPTTDWQLTANDSTSGGANKFSIEDITGARVPFTVTGAAPTNSLFVSNTGRVGLRTSTPVLDLHFSTPNTPATRLEQTSAGGFSAQTWDIAGNEANFFVRDVTGGSRLPFRIRPGAPTSSLDIAASGNVGMGTASPSASLHVRGTDGSTGLLVEETSATTAARNLINLQNNGGARVRFNHTGNGNAWLLGQSVDGSEMQMTLAGSGATEFRLNSAGNLTVTGTLTKGGGAFRIDHPLDPANKYLYHSFVESNDMLNIYNGNVELDANGEAVITMPDWFSPLNSEFRYQLTSIGAAAPDLHVSQTVEGNTFRIAGGRPGGRVSWQVTGVRQDPFAQAKRIPVEEMKPLAERGTYLFAGYYESEAQHPAADVELRPEEVIVAKNSEIRSLEIENDALRSQLETLSNRLLAIESVLISSPATPSGNGRIAASGGLE